MVRKPKKKFNASKYGYRQTLCLKDGLIVERGSLHNAVISERTLAVRDMKGKTIAEKERTYRRVTNKLKKNKC